MKKMLLIIILLFSININAGENAGVGIGPLYGYDSTTETNILGLDLSYTHFTIFTASIQPRLFLEETSSNNYGVDLQFTVWYPVLNIGGGLGYSSLGSENIVYHLFFGFPLPNPYFEGYKWIEVFYVEPYYRYNFYSDFNSHEFGIFIKVSNYMFMPR